jgi:glycine/D-amino acid oxidase-like deaminating enzyme
LFMVGHPHILIVGAGIVGASIAYHLACRGATVTLIERALPAGGATGKAFGWINISHGAFGPYSRLRQRAAEDWRRLEHELVEDVLRVHWCGALSWYSDPTATERFVRDRTAEGYEVRLVGREEIAAREPNLVGPPACAAYAGNEGMVDPSAATAALVRGAHRAGAQFRPTTEVVALTSVGGRITGARTAEGTIAADLVVMAAGIKAATLCRPLGIEMPVDCSPASLLQLHAARSLVNGVISAPDLEARQVAGILTIAADCPDDTTENGPGSVAQRTLAVVRRRLRGGDNVALDSITVGLRPIPADRLPILGSVPDIEGLYVAVMHSGVTMAPIIGRLVAAEILDGMDVDLFQPCRLERFTKAMSS